MNQLSQLKRHMKTSIKILSIILITLLISCQSEVKRKVYKTTDGKGYCYQDDDTRLWYLLYYNYITGVYDVTPTSSVPSYDVSSAESMDISVNTESSSAEMSQSTGEDTGGSDASNDSDGSGMSESSGSDSGGSDSGSSDGGGSDGGGGGE
jgi:hypothetical protein